MLSCKRCFPCACDCDHEDCVCVPGSMGQTLRPCWSVADAGDGAKTRALRRSNTDQYPIAARWIANSTGRQCCRNALCGLSTRGRRATNGREKAHGLTAYVSVTFAWGVSTTHCCIRLLFQTCAHSVRLLCHRSQRPLRLLVSTRLLFCVSRTRLAFLSSAFWTTGHPRPVRR